MAAYLLLGISFIFCYGNVLSNTVLFRSNERFNIVSESNVTTNAEEFRDPKNTGSSLLNGTGLASRALSLNILLSKFKSSSSDYFRAHPILIDCAQLTITRLQKASVAVEVKKGYQTASDVKGSTTLQDLYLRSGAAIQLGIKTGGSGTLLDIAGAALSSCPVVFENVQRNLGLILMADRVHIHMTGGTDRPHIATDGYTWTEAQPLNVWAQLKIDEGIEPVGTTNCDAFPTLASGSRFPDKNESEVVGTLDIQITRKMETDFKRLVQYQGNNIAFEDSESSASWCGEAGNTCKSCSSGIVGNSLTDRCADRVMSSRMYNVLVKLSKLIASKTPGAKLKVLEAWDEPYESHTNGDSSNPMALHYEGRAVKVKLNTGISPDLPTIAQLARCAGADFIQNNGDHLYISVKKMRGSIETDATRSFPNVQLLAVDVPEYVESYYSLPTEFHTEQDQKYPLFDSRGKENLALADGAILRQFTSRDSEFRYFRLNPLIVRCYRDVVYHENKWRKDGDPQINVIINRAFLANPEQNSMFDRLDKRYNTHNLGIALDISYDAASPAGYNVTRLARIAVQKCAPLFVHDKSSESEWKGLSLGLYKSSVFLVMDEGFSLWTSKDYARPEGWSEEHFEDEFYDLYDLAINKRIVDPDYKDQACLFSHPPRRQSITFKYDHPEHVKRRRRRRSVPTQNQCIPQADTPFCQSTAKHREEVVAEIRSMLDRKWYYHDKDEVLAALNGCFKMCGTCLEGSIYEDKVQQCNNFLHWISWDLNNDKSPDITNFYSRENLNTRRYACENGQHCIEQAPLFSLVAPSAELLYRPNPTKSVEEELYSSADNPTPVFSILEELYGIHATGKVKFWVHDDTEMTSMKTALKTVMLYNPNVTKIEIYVVSPASKDAVRKIVETSASDFVNNGCPEHSRFALTPYEVLDIPHHLKKRSADPPGLKEEKLIERRNWEKKWIDMEI
ncbi:hypothetical protein CHS0354_041752 [Potamilus streckersoni]|uniref:Hedgehog N-terminal signalling domain-containing protein n=1 Tax=Potamilus streckersoni TaxID=2493646 RepID=A0AAE0W647_9BIVA|nr:hypothetical protein CHS0354_041752 [Potamilus streckersoni]